jgi:SAM-dependent methyltransferase
MLGSKLSDRNYLLENQYRDASNLRRRMQLHERFSTNPYGWHLWVFDQLELAPSSRLLEIGCGPGVLWLENAARIPPGWDINLSDISMGMVQEARLNLSASQRQFKFSVSDAQALPFTSETFDAVVANHMLYHVPDQARALAEIQRILKPAGRLYAATNGRDHMKEIGELIRRFDERVNPGEKEYPFSLENGAAQLAGYFKEVSLRLHQNSLEVTEAEPLVVYIASTFGISDYPLTPDWQSKLSEFIVQELESQGSIHITKSAGLFIAQKDR